MQYRFRFATLFERHEQPERAVRLYQQILRDRFLRELAAPSAGTPLSAGPIDAQRSKVEGRRSNARRPSTFDLRPSNVQSAGSHAQHKIAELITRHGRSIYALHEAQARRWLESGRKTGDEESPSAGATLQRIVETFPNSQAAPLALVAHGELLARKLLTFPINEKPVLSAAKGRIAQDAAKRFASAYHRYPRQVDRPALLRKIADTFERAGKPEHAYRWLTKAAREYPGIRIRHKGRTVTFLEYRERLASVRGKVEPSRPNVVLPLNDQFVNEFEGQVALRREVAVRRTVSLLAPRFGDVPASRWSRYFVYAEAGPERSEGPGTIHAFDTRTGSEVWPEPAPARSHVELLIAMSDTAVFATLYELFALDLVTGARRWSFGEYPQQMDDPNGDWEDGAAFRSHSLQGNRLVSMRDDGEIICLEIDTGVIIWSQRHRPRPIGRVRLADPWVVYHIMQDGRVILCLIDSATGAWADAITTDENRTVEEVFVTLDGQIILVTSQSISSYDPESRVRRWRVSLRGHLRRPSLVLDIDALYFSEDGRRVKKISLEDGHRLWESEQLAGRGDDDISVQLQEGSVIISSTSSVSAVDAVTGLTLWQGATPESPRFVARFLSRSYVVAVDVPGEKVEAGATAYFYDHNGASGLIPRNGGAVKLGRLSDVRSVMAADGVLLVQTGSAIRGWMHK